MHALVIDDSRPVRSILVKMLQTLGFDTTEAENGLDGTARLAEFPKPDLILVNWNMPVMNGHEFLVKAKSGPSTCDIPVVVVSAETQQSEKEAALGWSRHVSSKTADAWEVERHAARIRASDHEKENHYRKIKVMVWNAQMSSPAALTKVKLTKHRPR